MQRFFSIIILLALLFLLPARAVKAGFFTDDTLVTIDGTRYTVDDFKRWWMFWDEDQSPLPKTPDFYVNWLLLSREGGRMDLASTPEFQRQTRIFIQTRALMLLRYDEVLSHVNVTGDDVKARYEEQYLPRWQVQRLIFKDEDAAMAAWQELQDGKLTVAELLGRDAQKGGPVSTKENWLRPKHIDPGWVAIFQKMKVGQVVDPEQHKKGPVLYLLKDQKGFEEEDFAKLRAEIRTDLKKEQENVLTTAMLKKLRKKYEVKVDQARLASLDINAADDTFTDEPVITSNRQNVSEKQFMAVIRRLILTRPEAGHATADKELADKLKAQTVDNIIGQSVTDWECLDRHYEEKEPFKPEYDFNFHHRLVQALEQRLFVPETKVTEDEIKQDYNKNIKQYMQATLVKLYLVDETQGPIDQIWAEVAAGKNFQEVTEKQFGIRLKATEAPVNHIDPEVKSVVEKLVEGETSPIFKAQGVRVIAYLIKRTPEAPIPLSKVHNYIQSKLKSQKVRKIRTAYLDKIKSHSTIEVNERQWKAVRKELAEAAKKKELEAAKKKELEAAKQKELGGK